MKRVLTVVALAALMMTTACYTSRRVAGDELSGGVLNPLLWVTVPVDTIMSPYQIPKWMGDESDTWNPFDVEKIREEYERPELNELAYRNN